MQKRIANKIQPINEEVDDAHVSVYWVILSCNLSSMYESGIEGDNIIFGGNGECIWGGSKFICLGDNGEGSRIFGDCGNGNWGGDGNIFEAFCTQISFTFSCFWYSLKSCFSAFHLESL